MVDKPAVILKPKVTNRKSNLGNQTQPLACGSGVLEIVFCYMLNQEIKKNGSRDDGI